VVRWSGDAASVVVGRWGRRGRFAGEGGGEVEDGGEENEGGARSGGRVEEEERCRVTHSPYRVTGHAIGGPR
jgi:hypothetical protein